MICFHVICLILADRLCSTDDGDRDGNRDGDRDGDRDDGDDGDDGDLMMMRWR
jgi:hypothetical protein